MRALDPVIHLRARHFFIVKESDRVAIFSFIDSLALLMEDLLCLRWLTSFVASAQIGPICRPAGLSS